MHWRTYLSGSILSCALAGRQLSTSLAPFAVIFGAALAHVVLRAGDSWVDVLLGTAGVRRRRRWLLLLLLLLLDRTGRTGLPSAGSQEMFS
jgi:hypothetical protein